MLAHFLVAQSERVCFHFRLCGLLAEDILLAIFSEHSFLREAMSYIGRAVDFPPYFCEKIVFKRRNETIFWASDIE